MGSQVGGLEIPDPCQKHIQPPLWQRPVILREMCVFSESKHAFGSICDQKSSKSAGEQWPLGAPGDLLYVGDEILSKFYREYNKTL